MIDFLIHVDKHMHNLQIKLTTQMNRQSDEEESRRKTERGVEADGDVICCWSKISCMYAFHPNIYSFVLAIC